MALSSRNMLLSTKRALVRRAREAFPDHRRHLTMIAESRKVSEMRIETVTLSTDTESNV